MTRVKASVCSIQVNSHGKVNYLLNAGTCFIKIHIYEKRKEKKILQKMYASGIEVT